MKDKIKIKDKMKDREKCIPAMVDSRLKSAKNEDALRRSIKGDVIVISIQNKHYLNVGALVDRGKKAVLSGILQVLLRAI